ncbi:M28 family peptidase [Flavobacterium agrisoli]|uniref:M28 family peptidase n=1 Tax=Flavobacterium agrisoli TaxID=2793066 RepID=A0A934UJB0_9FLAO|nr:M28 family peptidase [Flavobacterium agrisoli]MBK0369707.1 M28 family peptidase [Flavobacterium agrisoli]
MKNNFSSSIAIAFILGVLGLFYLTIMPRWDSKSHEALAEFSTDRAMEHIQNIAQKPHYVGSSNHDVVAKYIQSELTELGLETHIQEGYTMSDWGNLVKSKNIMARIKGTQNSKALVLLSHYDSAPHSMSKGASDDASGVATILEGVRAFIYDKQPHKNDIIILFTDAEELGLNGAALFVTEHQWAKEVGLVINFEARGSAGPSYMLMETTKGNEAMVASFQAAGVKYPVSNSLMYSVYKMLPNDTDLTVFREQGNIQGFNFAFIDGHYNYHTQQDDIQHIDPNSVTHQGTYLMPLLRYFANTNLTKLQTNQDEVYFSIPFAFIHYPFAWVLPMTLIAAGLLLLVLLLGFAKRIFVMKEILKGFIPFLGSTIMVGLVTMMAWKLLTFLYPQYNDFLNGFTYNGHAYMAAFVMLSLAICFAFYHYFSDVKWTMNHYVAPLLVWIVLNAILANVLPGAGFLIIPVYFGLILLAFFALFQGNSLFLNLIFSLPALLIIVPFIQMFPIGLGLKIMFGSAILTALTFGLILPIFGSFEKKGAWTMGFFIVAIGCFVLAHLQSGYEAGKAKSNSLLYVYNADTGIAKWATYDVNLDEWTQKYLGQNPEKATDLNLFPFFSKYNTRFTYARDAEKKTLLAPSIFFLKDTIRGNRRYLKIKIVPNRKVNRYDIFANPKMTFHHFKANGVSSLNQKGIVLERKGKKIVSYYVANNEPLEMEFDIEKNTIFDMDLVESSFDLLSNPLFSIEKRADWMMPTPFVLNDAVVIKQKIKTRPVENDPTRVYILNTVPVDSTATDSILIPPINTP